MPDMLNIIGIVGLILVACIAWVVWTERKSKQAFEKDALDQAWREAPDDPFSAERHHYEERKRVVDQARAGATTDPDCAPPGQCPRQQKLSYSTKDKEATMKKLIMLVGFTTLLASPALAQAPAGVYGTGNIIFPGDPSAAAAAGAYSAIVPGRAAGDAFAYEPAPSRAGSCAQRFKTYDARSGTYLGYDGRRHICR